MNVQEQKLEARVAELEGKLAAAREAMRVSHILLDSHSRNADRIEELLRTTLTQIHVPEDRSSSANMNAVEIKQCTVDQHVFVVIRCPARPTLSLDLMNNHGRRGLAVRVDGMGVAHLLVDLKELPAKGDVLFRYCSMCGEKLILHSSRGHHCKSDQNAQPSDTDE